MHHRISLCLALAASLALGSCSREAEPAPEADEQAEVAKKQAAPKAQPKPAAPQPQGATLADAAAEPKPELRFEMTQDGEAQTAEKFEEWMDQQGLRVADGPEGAAATDANTIAVPPKASAKRDADTQAGRQ